MTPFLGAGRLIGRLELLADVGFLDELRTLPGVAPRRELVSNAGAGYRLTSWAFPFVELNSAYAFEGSASFKHRAQLYISPGVRLSMPRVSNPGGAPPSAAEQQPPWWRRASLAVGAQFPVTGSREFEYTVIAGLKLDFE